MLRSPKPPCKTQVFTPFIGLQKAEVTTSPMAFHRRLKQIRLHSEGNNILVQSALVLILLNGVLFYFLKDSNLIPFYGVFAVSAILYGIALNFFRCPIRQFGGDPEGTVVAAADGRIGVIEEVEEALNAMEEQ